MWAIGAPQLYVPPFSDARLGKGAFSQPTPLTAARLPGKLIPYSLRSHCLPVSPSPPSASLPRARAEPPLEEGSGSAPHERTQPQRGDRPVGRHILDRAADYAALHRNGLTATQIARRRKKSKGYVSIVLRLGLALRTLDREELAVFRSERITWKLAQRVVREGVSDAEIHRQLRYALGGFSTHNIDRRKLRTRRGKGAADRGAHRRVGHDAGARDQVAGSGAFVWRWDAAWAARDPVGYVEAYRAYLASLHRTICAQFREAAAALTVGAASFAPVPMVGQSLRQITAALARQRPGSAASSSPALRAEDREALALLSAIDALLGGHEAVRTGPGAGRAEEPDSD